MSSGSPEHFRLTTAPSLTAASTTDVWVLLNRHLPGVWSPELVYIGLLVKESSGSHATVAVAHQEDYVSQFVLSDPVLKRLQTLYDSAEYSLVSPNQHWSCIVLWNLQVKLKARSQASFSIVAALKGADKANFTLSVFSHMPCQLQNLASQLPYSNQVAGQWTSSSAGGHHGLATFYQNPQYRVVLDAATTMNLVLQAIDMSAPINMKLLRGNERVLSCVVSATCIQLRPRQQHRLQERCR
jgi:hypothetical protein